MMLQKGRKLIIRITYTQFLGINFFLILLNIVPFPQTEEWRWGFVKKISVKSQKSRDCEMELKY